MTESDKGALWALFCLAILCTGVAAGWSGWAIAQGQAAQQIKDERTLAIKDMADAVNAVCADAEADPTSYPKAHACIGGLQMMIETIETKRKREAADAG